MGEEELFLFTMIIIIIFSVIIVIVIADKFDFKYLFSKLFEFSLIIQLIRSELREIKLILKQTELERDMANKVMNTTFFLPDTTSLSPTR